MTIAVDFDGVIHAYTKGWHDGTIYDKPLPDALAALELLMQRDAVFIHTTRNPHQVARWIERESWHDIDCTTRVPRTWYGRRKPFWNTRGLLLVTDRKLAATVYVDDRAHRFENWPTTMVALGEPVEHWPSAASAKPSPEQRITDAMAVIHEWQRDETSEPNGHISRIWRALEPPVSGTFEYVGEAQR